MEHDLENKNHWILITIDDPKFVIGKSILDIIELFLTKIKFQFVVINDIVGSGKDWLITSLQKKENTVMSLNELLKSLLDVNQFDWGDFFLFKEYPKDWEEFEDKPYPVKINRSDTTVRAIDNQYIYVHTPYQQIVDLIKQNYIIESLSEEPLENLLYPF